MVDERDPEQPSEGAPSEPSAEDAADLDAPSEEASAPPAPGLSPRRAPLRGTGSGVGATEGDSGGIAEMMRRVRDVAQAARAAAEERRPAAERAVRDAAERARAAGEAARPEVERLARQAKAAAEAARPHIERGVHEAADYVREHEDELRNAASKAARFAAPAPLRPALDAMQGELQRRDPPAKTSEEDATDDGPAAPSEFKEQ